MKVEVIKGVKHSVELNFGDTSVCINTDEAQNLIAQLRAVVPAPADIREAEIKKINITPSEVRYVIDAIHSYAGIFSTDDDAKKGLAIFKAGEQHERERMMKEAPVVDVIEMRGSTEKGYPLELTLGFPRLPNIEYHGGAVRVIIEEINY